MKKLIQGFTVLLVSMTMILLSSIGPLKAKESITVDLDSVSETIETEINEYAKYKNISTKFENFTIEIVDQSLSNQEIEKRLERTTKILKDYVDSITIELDYVEIQPNGSFNSRNSSNLITPLGLKRDNGGYVCSVWCGVPSIGWGHVNQDFKASVNNSRISSVTMLGQSYKTGLTLFGWHPVRSWSTVQSRLWHDIVRIHMKGTLSFILEGIQVGSAQTFMWEGYCSGTGIVDQLN